MYLIFNGWSGARQAACDPLRAEGMVQPLAEPFAKVLSAGNRDLLRVIVEQEPGCLHEFARITGKAKSNLSRTLKTMAVCGLFHLAQRERNVYAPAPSSRARLLIPVSEESVDSCHGRKPRMRFEQSRALALRWVSWCKRCVRKSRG